MAVTISNAEWKITTNSITVDFTWVEILQLLSERLESWDTNQGTEGALTVDPK